jgi:hypothetical protein
MTKIDITPIDFGLGLGTATQLRINVDYDLNSPDVTLRCFAYNADGVQLNVTPINLDVPGRNCKSGHWTLIQ